MDIRRKQVFIEAVILESSQVTQAKSLDLVRIWVNPMRMAPSPYSLRS